jgi:hypothetical protein
MIINTTPEDCLFKAESLAAYFSSATYITCRYSNNQPMSQTH